MQELGKFNFKINIVANGLEKYMSFNISNKLAFIDGFQSLSSPLDSLVEKLGKVDFEYLSQEFDSNVLDLAKGLNLYQYMNCFEKIKEELPSKEKVCSSLIGKKKCDKEYEYS